MERSIGLQQAAQEEFSSDVRNRREEPKGQTKKIGGKLITGQAGVSEIKIHQLLKFGLPRVRPLTNFGGKEVGMSLNIFGKDVHKSIPVTLK